jgi:hypothetical protein
MKNKPDYKLLKEIINNIDPIGLIDLETPESLDEYDPEIREILKEDVSSLNLNQFSNKIYEVFVKFFNKDLAGGTDQYDLIARKFFEKQNKS